MSEEETAGPSSIAALTQRMAAGDDAAFSEFHQAYASRLFRYLLALHRGDGHTASDVLQETLIRVVRHVRRFEDEQVLWDWLAKLARSAAADHGRKGSRYRRFLDRFSTHSIALPEIPDDGHLLAALQSAMDQLPPEERDLLQAKYDHGQSVRDLARQHLTSEDAIQSRLARARRRLRDKAFQILEHSSNPPP